MNLRKIMLLAVALLTFVVANANNLLPNGSFDKVSTKSSDFPAEWRKAVHGKAKADFKLVKHGDGKVLQITKLNADKWVECLSGNIPVKLDSVKIFEVSGMIKSEDIKSGTIVLSGFDQKGKVQLWKRLVTIKGSSDWKEIKTYTFIPSAVKKIRLSLRINQGGGYMLFDDFKILQIDNKLPTGVQLLKTEWLGVYGKNTGKLPVDWTAKSWSAHGNPLQDKR